MAQRRGTKTLFMRHPRMVKTKSVTIEYECPDTGRPRKKAVGPEDVLVGENWREFVKYGILVEVFEDKERPGYVKIPSVGDLRRQESIARQREASSGYKVLPPDKDVASPQSVPVHEDKQSESAA